MLFRQLTSQGRHIRVHPLTLLVGKRREIVPVALEGVGNVVRGLGIAQLEDGVVVECPVLRLLVLAPELVALDTEDLHADASWGGDVVGDDFGGER